MTLKDKVRLARIDGENRRQIEYSAAKFIEAYSYEDSPSSREDARDFATRLLANQATVPSVIAGQVRVACHRANRTFHNSSGCFATLAGSGTFELMRRLETNTSIGHIVVAA
jgi:hypothetical protein